MRHSGDSLARLTRGQGSALELLICLGSTCKHARAWTCRKGKASKQPNRSLIGGEHVAFASLQRIIPPKALIQYWHSPLRRRFHASEGLMMELQVLALAVARLFGLIPFGGDAVRHRCDEYRYPAGRQADVESHEFPGLLGYVSSVNPISSSGVQIVGGSKPAFLQTLSIRLRRVAFAMCLKFQVRRYFTPLVAAMEM